MGANERVREVDKRKKRIIEDIHGIIDLFIDDYYNYPKFSFLLCNT